MNPFILQLGMILIKIICLLVVIAYYTIAERKIIASIQRRRGPNVVGFWGLLQPVADGLKLIAKEMIMPSHANSRIFVLAPMVILTLGLVSWSIVPFGCFDYSETATNAEILNSLQYNEPKLAGAAEILGTISGFVGIALLLPAVKYSWYVIKKVYIDEAPILMPEGWLYINNGIFRWTWDLSSSKPPKNTSSGGTNAEVIKETIVPDIENKISVDFSTPKISEVSNTVLGVEPALLQTIILIITVFIFGVLTSALLFLLLSSRKNVINSKNVTNNDALPNPSTVSTTTNKTAPMPSGAEVGAVEKSGDKKNVLLLAIWPANTVLEINQISDIRYSLLIILAISSLSVYALIIAGWASNSKYAFLGALRSAAQIISYEVSISLVVLPIIFLAGSLNFTEIIVSQQTTTLYVLPLLPLSIIFFIASLAETNRTPFDLPEAEAELVAGYNIEYSSIIFAMFFLGEYGNITLMSVINSDLFFGGWVGALFDSLSALVISVKAVIIAASFVLVRATFPRYRYDQLIDIGWKIFLPVATGLIVAAVGIVITWAALPVVNELLLFSTVV